MKVGAYIPIGWMIWSPWMLVVTFQNLGLEESPTKKYLLNIFSNMLGDLLHAMTSIWLPPWNWTILCDALLIEPTFLVLIPCDIRYPHQTCFQLECVIGRCLFVDFFCGSMFNIIIYPFLTTLSFEFHQSNKFPFFFIFFLVILVIVMHSLKSLSRFSHNGSFNVGVLSFKQSKYHSHS